MRRMTITALVTLAAMLLVAVPALATDADDVVVELELRGYFIERGANADFEALERLVEEWPDIYYVALARDPSGGTDLLASEALESLGVEGTVIVVSPVEIGSRSTIYSTAELDAAVDRAFDLFDTSFAAGFEEFADSLSVETAGVVVTTQASQAVVTTAARAATGDTSSATGGGNGGLILLLVIVAVGLLIWWAIRRSKRSRDTMFQERIVEVKAEIQGQLSEAANDILELEDDIVLSDNEEAKNLYYTGSAAYAEFQERLAGATSFAELDELAEGADLALWQLESAEAILEGGQPPPKPEARPDFEPPQPTAGQRRHPELPEDLQIRRDRRQQRGTRPRQRSSGGLGGLGAAAVILRSLQEGRRPRVDSARSASRSQRSTGVQMPNLGESSSTSPRPARSRRSPTARRPTARKPTLKGRTRRRRK